MVDQVIFPCDICKKDIVIGSDDRIKVVTKQTISDDFFGTLITYLAESLKEKLDPSIIETAACPVGDLSETVIINSVLDQVSTEQVIGNLRARMREEEFEIVVAHLLREIPELEALIHSR